MHLSCEDHSIIKWALSSHVFYVSWVITSIETSSASLLLKPGVNIAFILWMGNSESLSSIYSTIVFRTHQVIDVMSICPTTFSITIVPITTSILLACMWCCKNIEKILKHAWKAFQWRELEFDFLRFQSHLIVYIFKVSWSSWLFTLSKSADCLHLQIAKSFQCQLIGLIVYIFKVRWFNFFSKSVDCLYFQKKLMFYLFRVIWLKSTYLFAWCICFPQMNRILDTWMCKERNTISCQQLYSFFKFC